MTIKSGVRYINMINFANSNGTFVNKKLSCRREAARCFVFVSSQLQHRPSTVFLLLVTAASDFLVHKILLNSVLLSSIVSGRVRRCLSPTKPPGQTPLGHTSLVFCRLWVTWGHDPYRGSDRVRSTGSVSFQQKYPPGSVLRCPTSAKNGFMTKGVVSGWG